MLHALCFMPKLIDVHAHIQFAAYGDESDDVIRRALDNGIWIVNVGTQQSTSEDAVELADKYDEGVYATVGLHPIHTAESYHDEKELGGGEAAREFTGRGEEFDYEAYRDLARHEKVVAIGECGLDYYRLNEDTKERQVKAFRGQIELAHKLEKPLMIHCRGAFSDLREILRGERDKLQQFPGIVHFFAGGRDDARELIDLGFYFSFGGVITFTRDYDEVIEYIGLERIVLETDAPYVAPAPFRGRRNEPSYLVHTAEKLAELLGVSAEEVAERTTANARAVLDI